MLGVLFGAVTFGQLSDLFGRKRTMLVAHFGMLVFNYWASTTTSIYYFTIVQTMAMCFVGGHNAVMHVFLIENVPIRLRILLTTMCSYSPNFVLLAIAAYFSQHWRTLLQVCSLLNIPAFFLLM
jgi:MFS family permease